MIRLVHRARIGGIWLSIVMIGLVIGSLSVEPAGAAVETSMVEAQESPALWGIADTHNHQFANLGFGGLMIWGDVFRWDDNIAKALPWSDFLPGRYGDVLNYGGTSRQLDASAWSLTYPNVPATCPPGTGGLFEPPCRGFSIHGAGGLRDLLNSALSGRLGHGVAGYPQFDGYPRWNTYTGQQMYYKWLERAWRDGGLRLMVMFAVNNEALCGAIDRKAGYTCEDMPAIDRQIQAAKDLERFVDTQYGGQGQGWYRIAYSPAQAREIVAAGKLAVILGIETPTLFGCKVVSDCTDEYVLTELRRYRDMGVRHFYPLHNADNGFGGTGLYNDLFTINTKAINGEWFDVTNECDPRIDFHLDLLDWLQNDDGSSQDPVVGFARLLLSILTGQGIDPPRPPAGPNCNARDLQPLGETLITGMMDLKMIIDVDHLSTRTFDDVMTLVEARNYPGIVSSHAGFIDMGIPRPTPDAKSIRYEANKTPEELARIRAQGGLLEVIIHQGDRSIMREYTRNGVAPVPYRCGSSSEAWAQAYLYAVDQMQGSAVALATDMNGLAGLPAPRFGWDRCDGDVAPGYDPTNRVVYSTDPSQGLTQMQVGNKRFDYNYDGFANVGMLPDFIQDARNVGMSEADLAPLFSSAEAYIRMWEQVGDFAPDPVNSAPAAYAGGPYLALAGSTVTLQGTGSDADGDPLTFSWDLDGNGVFETAGATITFSASGQNRDVPVVMRACDSHAGGSESVCTSSRTFVRVRTPGHVYAWGGNVLGQLGVPPAEVPYCGAPNRCSPTPVSVPPLLDVVDVAAGHRRSVALRSNGTVWVWGGDTGSTPLQMGELGGVVAISAGNEHALALKSDGTVWAWGANEYGQLGLGDRSNRSLPVQVPTGGRIIAISAGDRFSLALRDNGDIIGWGYNHDYQLGSQCWQGGDITIPPGECLSPVRIFGFGGPDTVAIAAGSTWSHALDRTGAVWVQGGVHYETGQPRLIPFRVGGLTLSKAISAGTWDHVLALRGDGYVWGYGRNAWGQVNLEECRDANDFCWPSEGSTYGQKVAVAAGFGHSLALHAGGQIAAWGTNFNGQLGRGTWGETGTTPEWIRLLRGAIAVAAGYDHSLAIVPTTFSFTVQPNAQWANFYLPGLCSELNGEVDCSFISVPTNFTSEPVTFVYTFQHAPGAEAAGGLGSSLKYVGSSFTLEARGASGDPITSFSAPFNVHIYYNDADWQRAGVLDELMLDVYNWDGQSGQWQANRPLCSDCSRLFPASNLDWLRRDQLDPLTEFALLGLRDEIPPEVTATAVPEANAAGWNNAGVVVTLSAADDPGGSGVLNVSYSATGAQPVALTTVDGDTATITISAEGQTTLTYYAEDQAHNVSMPALKMISIDQTAPVTEVTVTGEPGQNDWFVADVTLSLDGGDNLSGVVRTEYTLDSGATYQLYAEPLLIAEEGTTTILARSVDNADNIEMPVMTAVKLDKTGPAITITTPEPFAVLPVGTAFEFSASDAVSGIQTVEAWLGNGSTMSAVTSGDTITQAGIYTLDVRATDVAGHESSATRTFVVYDPNGGFVTGGGWIDSPAGAYAPDPALAGKATFGFVSRYQKGATVPTGTTQFQFRVADLSFDSTRYDWLVVNQDGTNAQFKGSGTVNGAGSYRFMLWAGDGAPDTFRIKIWEEVDGIETVIYDNGMEQPVGGGSILVHKN